MRSLNPLEGEFYREALQVSRSTREMFCLMEGRHVHPSTLYPGGVGTVATVQLFTDYLTRLMRYVEFMKRVVPMHDDLFDFFYEALPGYEEVGRRRVLLGCWGSLNNPEYCDFTYRNMADWGRKMFVTPGVVVDGKLVTTSLVDINLGIRILLGHSFYEDWEDQEMFVTQDPLGNPVDRRHPWNQHTIPRPAKRDFDDKYSWTMSPRWFDGKDYLPLDTGGGPIARLWATALAGMVDCGYVKSTGHSVQINLPRTVSRPEVTFEWSPPMDKQGKPLSNAIERDRARTYFQAYAAACALYFVEQALAEIRAGPDQDLGVVHRAGRLRELRLHRGGARRPVAPHGGQGREDRELPPVPADPVERQRPRHLRDARTLRGRGAEHPDLRGEPAGQLQGHRHHAGGAQLRPVPALRRAHVPGRRQGHSTRRTRRPASHWRSDMADAMDAREIDARETGARVEALLAELRARSGPEAADLAEELVTCLVRLYGAGLEAIMRTIGDDQRLQALLIADPLVESLLLVHDLHPLRPDARIRRALGHLGVGAEFLGIDDAGVVEVRLGHGCGSTTADIEQVVTDAAPETTGSAVPTA